MLLLPVLSLFANLKVSSATVLRRDEKEDKGKSFEWTVEFKEGTSYKLTDPGTDQKVVKGKTSHVFTFFESELGKESGDRHFEFYTEGEGEDDTPPRTFECTLTGLRFPKVSFLSSTDWELRNKEGKWLGDLSTQDETRLRCYRKGEGMGWPWIESVIDWNNKEW
ncbi:uncharacterized protein I303_106090 [Kwoniella dejecticola CBS 10117]|uniref:Uncharacterized protein n=1 Tax=Kwoniella dejecticola CBS 10117 TaxID=1296121 RepID=A0A1A6A189_9TREE|nr:uncharacterized protein I303_06109 [Kwoniella dejecticola CBS 10117]OBR83826.1 hypothetical protein I303_06109 [Kwoniella dejecticola CBS 10117]